MVETNNHIKCNFAETALMQVLDPEIGLNIVDLGLIYEINFNESNKNILVKMTLTTQFCPMGETIIQETERKIRETFPDYLCEIALTFDPEWDYSRISETGKNYLNLTQ